MHGAKGMAVDMLVGKLRGWERWRRHPGVGCSITSAAGSAWAGAMLPNVCRRLGVGRSCAP